MLCILNCNVNCHFQEEETKEEDTTEKEGDGEEDEGKILNMLEKLAVYDITHWLSYNICKV